MPFTKGRNAEKVSIWCHHVCDVTIMIVLTSIPRRDIQATRYTYLDKPSPRWCPCIRRRHWHEIRNTSHSLWRTHRLQIRGTFNITHACMSQKRNGGQVDSHDIHWTLKLVFSVSREYQSCQPCHVCGRYAFFYIIMCLGTFIISVPLTNMIDLNHVALIRNDMPISVWDEMNYLAIPKLQHRKR